MKESDNDMIEVTYCYNKGDTTVIIYQSAMYEVPYNVLMRTGIRYKIPAKYLTETYKMVEL